MATKIAGLSDERAEILHDPMLVEDFSDVVRPTIRAEESGSVVMTPTSAATPTHALEHEEMDYSDSEFEDNLEQRMMDLRGGEVSSTDTSLNEARTELRNKLEQERPSLEFSDDDDDDDDDSEEEEDDEEGEFQPLAPPQELDPDKLYALYAFNGPDTSHCPLEQDESCLLLNDQDSYWWLVKRVRDNRIGFAPAEILETFPERLARLNCWKNENLSSSSRLDEKHKTHLENYNNSGKSVSFNDIVSYADRYVDEDTVHEDTFGNEATRFNDEISDTVSDVSFSTGYTQPLEYKKTRKSPEQIEDDTLQNDIEGLLNPTKITSTQQRSDTSEDDLTKVFEAPVVPFKQNKLHTSRSENSISSIGEFSPSSSDQTNDDSPRELTTNTTGSPRQRPLPQSHALHHISNIVTSSSSSSSTPSSSPATSHEEFAVVPSTKDGPHPTIVKIYEPFFSQIDTLIMHLDTLLHPQTTSE